MDQDIIDHYDKLYAEGEETYAGTPMPFLEKLLDHVNSGTVLDVGAGTGRHSILLAERGFDVTAIDISPVGIERLKRHAEKKGVHIDAKVVDVYHLGPEESYDIVVCTYVLHALERDSALELSKNIKQLTRPGGYNVIVAWTKHGGYYKSSPDSGKFYLEDDELKDIYRDWETKEYIEKEAEVMNKEGTEAKKRLFAGIIAQKPKQKSAH